MRQRALGPAALVGIGNTRVSRESANIRAARKQSKHTTKSDTESVQFHVPSRARLARTPGSSTIDRTIAQDTKVDVEECRNWI